MNQSHEADKLARETALDVKQSFIVQAPAGSGKTELLIQRYLALLTTVQKPEEISAITFTKKAAHEMRARILKALKQAEINIEVTSAHQQKTRYLALKVLERDHKLQWQILKNPNQLRIETIDALCSYLTKQLPLLSHFGSQPDITTDPFPLYRDAVREVLTHIEEQLSWSNAIANLLLHLDNDYNKLHDLLVNLLAKRDQWLRYIHLDTDNVTLRAQLESQLAAVITAQLQVTNKLISSSLKDEIISIALFAANHTVELAASREINYFPTAHAKHLLIWKSFAKLLLTKQFEWRKRIDASIGFPALSGFKNPEEKKQHIAMRERFSSLLKQLSEEENEQKVPQENLRNALQEIALLPLPFYNDEQWEIIKALLLLLKVVASQLRVVFQQTGQIDFIENAQAALLALGDEENPTDLALALDYQIKHILIDEFQDTSRVQFQLLEKLILGWQPNDGRTLFIVGDPMQSIYRFRQAEVSLFLQIRDKGVGNLTLTPLALTTNFRSTKKIVEWNNKYFSLLFPYHDNAAQGAVSFHRSVANAENEVATNVIIYGLNENSEKGHANYAINLIQKLLQASPEETIAILVRSRTHLRSIIPALKKARLPYQAIDIDPLVTRQAIQDLLSLTCALLQPANRIAWLAILRAPWCGLTLTDLHKLIAPNPYATIWEQLLQQEVIATLSDDAKARLTRITAILRQKINERNRIPLRSLVESTWLLLGGPATLQDNNDLQDVKAFFTLLDEFNMQDVLLNIEHLLEKINHLYASTTNANATIQIMTIHTAKGLEFDTVILPHLERKMPYDDKALLQWLEQPLSQQHALILAPIHRTGSDDPIYDYVTRQQRIKLAYETDRLFYVAATRAKKQLFMLFNATEKNDTELKLMPGSFLAKIWPFLKHQSAEMIESANSLSDENNNAKQSSSLLRLTSQWKNTYQEKIIKATLHNNNKQKGYLLPNSHAQLVGTVTHRILQKIAENGSVWWQQQSFTAQQNFLYRQVMLEGFSIATIHSAITQIQNMLNNMLQDERGKWILTPHQAAKTEFALTAVLDGTPHKLVIDRTFIDEANIRWIIDYKTTIFTPNDIPVFLQNQQEKYLAKLTLYARALQLQEKNPIKLGLYFPAFPLWHEWQLEH